VRLEYIRPTFAADINYILLASEGTGIWFDGTAGDITFEVTESQVVPNGQELEKVTLLLEFTDEVPNSLFFQLTADITDLP
jgi:hypothetical protein